MNIFKGPTTQEVLDEFSTFVRQETEGKINIQASSFPEFFEEFFLEISSVEEWNIYPQTIEDVNEGSYLYEPTGLITVLDIVQSVDELSDDEADNLQDINIYERIGGGKNDPYVKRMKNVKVGAMLYDDKKGLEGDLYFIIDNKGKIYKAIFLFI